MLVTPSGEAGPIALSGGPVSKVPSDAEVALNVPRPTLMSHSHSPFIGSDSGGVKEKAGVAPSADPTTPERAADEPSAPRPERPCSASEATRPEGGASFRAEYQLPP